MECDISALVVTGWITCRKGVGSDGFFCAAERTRGAGIRGLAISIGTDAVVADRGRPLMCVADSIDGTAERDALLGPGVPSIEEREGVDTFVEDGTEASCRSFRFGSEGFDFISAMKSATAMMAREDHLDERTHPHVLACVP